MLYLIDPMDTSSKLQELLQQKKNAQMEAGKQFLAENAKRAEVHQTPTGLQYEILQAGAGNKPGPTTMVTVHYEGKLIDGTVFDSSFKRNQPATFGLHQVIPGWTEGVQLMNEGATFRFYIPYELGYGARGAGGAIPPYATLIFDVQLIKVG